jgi:hypothetical protein
VPPKSHAPGKAPETRDTADKVQMLRDALAAWIEGGTELPAGQRGAAN